MSRRGTACCGGVRYGMAGLVRRVVARYGEVRCGRRGEVCQDRVWLGAAGKVRRCEVRRG
jgi:hypothetical protein